MRYHDPTTGAHTRAAPGSRTLPGAWRVWLVTLVGLLNLLLYHYGISAAYPLDDGLRSIRPGWASLAFFDPWAGLRLAAVFALLTLGYAAALHLFARSPTRQHSTVILIVVVWLAASVTLLRAYPGESNDIFDYLFRGRMLAEFGTSPLAISPTPFRSQLFYERITWRGQVDTYGPLWEYASGAVAWIVGRLPGEDRDRLAWYIQGYRLLAIGLAGVCGALIGTIVRRAAPQAVSAALLAWFWNPLLLITTAVGAHNDVLMLVGILATFWCFQRRFWVAGFLVLVLAAHVKLTALLILPVLVAWLVRRQGWPTALRVGAMAAVLALPLSWVLYAPLGGWATLPRMLAERARFLANSPADLAYRLLQVEWGWAEAAARQATTFGATVVFGLAAVGLCWAWIASTRRPADTPLWRATVALTMAYLLIGCFWFQHWYVLWVLAPATLLPTSRFTRVLLPAYSLGVFTGQLAGGYVAQAGLAGITPVQGATLVVLIQTVPLLVAAIVSVNREQKPGARSQASRGASEQVTG